MKLLSQSANALAILMNIAEKALLWRNKGAYLHSYPKKMLLDFVPFFLSVVDVKSFISV